MFRIAARFLRLSLAVGFVYSISGIYATAQSPDLIMQPPNAQQVVRLHDVRPEAQPKYLTGRLPGATPLKRMMMVLKINPTQKTALDEYVRETTDSTSPNFHKWITPDQFGQTYGPSTADIAQVTSWLTGQGFSIDKVTAGRTVIEFSGTSSQVEAAFQTQMNTYTVNGVNHIANSIGTAIPQALAPVVSGVLSLNDFFPTPISGQTHPSYTSPGQGFHLVTPADFATIYDLNPLYKAGITGAGQTIGIIGVSNVNPQDIAAFRTASGLPPIKLNVVLDGPDPGLGPDEVEQDLDVEISGGVAPQATIDLILAASDGVSNGVVLAETYAVNNNVAPVLSESYGECESGLDANGSGTYFQSQVMEQAAAQGITFAVGSGDNGVAMCDFGIPETFEKYGYAVNGLASSAYDVAVGGTEFMDTTNPATYWSATNGAGHESALGYIPEAAWSQPALLYGSGGGASSDFGKPTWQTGPGVPNDGSRDLPDVSFLAGGADFYLYCQSDAGADCSSPAAYGAVGGTSASTPAFAGIMALVNQQTASIQGNADPVIYAMANNPTLYAKAFHDVTVGANNIPTATGGYIGYNATPGYDLATGWGSLDGYQFVTNFKALGTQATTLTIAANQTTVTHGDDVTFNVTLSANSGSAVPTGDVAFLATNSAGTQSIGFQSYDGSTNTYTFDTLGHVPGGQITVTARYGGDSNFAPSNSNSVTLTVNPEPSLVTVNSIQAPYPLLDPSVPLQMQWGAGNLQGIVEVQGANSGDQSPTGTISLLFNGASGSPFTPVKIGENLQAGATAATLTLFNNSIQVGTDQLAVSYSGDLAYSPSTSATYTLIVLPAPTQTILGTDVNMPLPNTVVNLQATIYENAVFQPVATGSITFFDDSTNTSLGTVSLPSSPNSSFGFFGAYNVTLPVQFASGAHNIVAQYSGDNNNLPNYSTGIDVTVAAKSSTISVLTVPSSSNGAVAAGVSTALVDTITGNSNGPVPSGMVTFSDGATPIGTAQVLGGIATLNTTTLAVGTHNLFAVYNGDSNFLGSTSGFAVQVTVADLTFTTPTTALTVQAGASSQAVIFTDTDTNGLYAGNPVAYTCSGLPAGAACVFNPSTAQFLPNSTYTAYTASTSMIITTTGPTLAASLQTSTHNRELAGLGTGKTLTLAFLLLLIPMYSKKGRKFGFLAMLLLMIGMTGMSGCGNPGTTKYAITNQGTPAGTYTVTVTSTTGTTVNNTSIQLTVASAVSTK